MSNVITSYYTNNKLIKTKQYKDYDVFVREHSYKNYVGFFEGRFYIYLLGKIGVKNNLLEEIIDMCRYNSRFENGRDGSLCFVVCGWCRGLNYWKEYEYTITKEQGKILIGLIKEQSKLDNDIKMGVMIPIF